MRDNWNTSIAGDSIILVPYKRCFVEKYHSWMQDPSLLEATASEPLSLEEEYDMQKLWRHDVNKCTFIVLSKRLELDDNNSELSRMAGDVNIFLNDHDDKYNAEIEIMIAEPRYRRCGMATEALKLMIYFGTTQLKITRFFAKINKKNIGSIALFRSLSFREINYVEAFEEYEYELQLSVDDVQSLIQEWGVRSNTEFYERHDTDEIDDVNDKL